MPLECDFCGDTVSELAILDYDGWAPDQLTCEECFVSDDGPDFSDLPSLKDRDRLIKKFTPLVKSLVKRHPEKDHEELFSGLLLELVKAANWHVKQSTYGDGSFYNVAKMRLGSFAATFETDAGNGVTLHDNHIDPTPSPEELLIHSERLKDAEKLLKNLDPEQSRAIGLTLGGRTQAEVGKIMGVSQQTVSNLLKAGIVAIRQHK